MIVGRGREFNVVVLLVVGISFRVILYILSFLFFSADDVKRAFARAFF